MKLLALSDTEIGFIYSPMVSDRFSDVDIVISCGDLPYFYLEFIVSMLNVPMFFVHGNHANQVEFGSTGTRTSPWGATNLDQRVIEDETGLLLAGLEGSLQYNQGPHQYSQRQYWQKVFSLVPRLMINKARVGRYLDVFVTHAPPWKIHDMDDLPHRGIKAFKWLIDVFQPAFHLHGHIHIYRQDTIMKTTVGTTQVLNVYGYREITMPFPQKRSWMKTRI
jgi:Icc-related predicted phosphoesterase